MHINTDTSKLNTHTHTLTWGGEEAHTLNTHAPHKRCLSHLLSFLLPPSKIFLSFPTDFAVSLLPSSFSLSPPSLLEISEKIAEGQFRGWLPLCVTSKDKYSQDDSHCLEDVYVCTCCSTPRKHTHTHLHTYVSTCANVNTHTVVFPLCSVWHSRLRRGTTLKICVPVTSFISPLPVASVRRPHQCVRQVYVCISQVINANSCSVMSLSQAVARTQRWGHVCLHLQECYHIYEVTVNKVLPK